MKGNIFNFISKSIAKREVSKAPKWDYQLSKRYLDLRLRRVNNVF